MPFFFFFFFFFYITFSCLMACHVWSLTVLSDLRLILHTELDWFLDLWISPHHASFMFWCKSLCLGFYLYISTIYSSIYLFVCGLAFTAWLWLCISIHLFICMSVHSYMLFIYLHSFTICFCIYFKDFKAFKLGKKNFIYKTMQS